MRVRVVFIVLVVMVLLVGCSSPHQLPTAPTPIPRLIPATLPAGKAEPTVPAETEMPGGATEPSPGGDPAQGQQVFEADCRPCVILCRMSPRWDRVWRGCSGIRRPYRMDSRSPESARVDS